MTDLFNIESEQGLLGALLTNNDAFLHIQALEEKHFYEPLHRRIFSTIFAKWQGGEHFSPVTLRPLFDDDPDLIDIGGGSYLYRLAAHSITVIHIADYAALLIDLAGRRALLNACEQVKLAICDVSTRVTTVEIATQASINFHEAISEVGEDKFLDDFQVMQAILEDMNRNVSPYKTGYEALDAAMGGGLYPGKSYGFAARAKTGKTIFAGSLSCNLNIKGVRHLFVCGEMSPAEIQKRTLARLLKENASKFSSEGGEKTAFMQRIADLALSSKRALIYKNAPGLTLEALKRYVLLNRMQKKITGFILDYWQLVGGKPKGKSTAEHLDEVAQWIADTCRKYDLWSIVMAQVNQEGNTRGGEGIRLAFDQVYVLKSPNNDPGRRERWLEMSDTRYTPWRSVGSANNPGFYLNECGPHFSEKVDQEDFGL